MTELSVVQRRCESLAASLSPPVPWSLHGFVDHVVELRGREIHLYAQRLPAGVSSFWFRAETADHIVYAGDALSDQHRDHLVLHEVSHMLLGHPGVPMTLLNEPAAMRAAHGGAEEQEAELLAGAILQRWRIPDGVLLVVEADVDRVMKTYDSTWEATPHVRPRLRRRPRPGPSGRNHRPDQEPR